jgi:outer membrane biosynthesis protein TonB
MVRARVTMSRLPRARLIVPCLIGAALLGACARPTSSAGARASNSNARLVEAYVPPVPESASSAGPSNTQEPTPEPTSQPLAPSLPASNSPTAGTAPKFRVGKVTVIGRLPEEVVVRIVRPSYGAFRVCYEKLLADDPSARGRVHINFVIGTDGEVVSASDAGSELLEPRFVPCLLNAIRSLNFPEPESGDVVVSYPIVFGA